MFVVDWTHGNRNMDDNIKINKLIIPWDKIT